MEKLGQLGEEFGATTGRKRQCNWLNIDRLIRAINVNGVTDLIINKCDIIEKLGIYKLTFGNERLIFSNFEDMKYFILNNIDSKLNVIFSGNKETI